MIEKYKVLYIDACVRDESRTRRLANTLLQKLDGEVESIKLYEQELPFTDKDLLATGMLGIAECQMFSAENLDIIGNDVEGIMQAAELNILSYHNSSLS